MRLLSLSTVLRFCQSLPGSERAAAEKVFRAWTTTVEASGWRSYADVKATFNTADWLGGGKVVFDVGGNKYRVVCLIGFRSQKAFVLFVGTHRQYDDIDVTAL